MLKARSWSAVFSSGGSTREKLDCKLLQSRRLLTVNFLADTGLRPLFSLWLPSVS